MSKVKKAWDGVKAFFADRGLRNAIGGCGIPVGLIGFCVWAIVISFAYDSVIVAIVCCAATLGFAVAIVRPAVQLWRDRGVPSAEIKRVQAVMYLAAAVGGAMVAVSRAAPINISCFSQNERIICESAALGNDEKALLMAGLCYLSGGFFGLVLEFFRQLCEDEESAQAARA